MLDSDVLPDTDNELDNVAAPKMFTAAAADDDPRFMERLDPLVSKSMPLSP